MIRQGVRQKFVLTALTVFLSMILLSGVFHRSAFESSNEFGYDDDSLQLEGRSLRNRRHIFSQVTNSSVAEHLKFQANVHYWDYVCGYNVESLRSHPLFPFSPFRRAVVDNLHLEIRDVQFGARLFGYILPDKAGYYRFAISSDDSSELWLSPSKDPLHVKLLAKVGDDAGYQWTYENQFTKYPNQSSDFIYLRSDKAYFFDVLWKQERGRGHVKVVWQMPGSEEFTTIGSQHLSKYYNDDMIEDGLVYFDHLKDDLRLEDLPSHVKQFQKTKSMWLSQRTTPYQRDSTEFLSLPIVDFQTELKNVLNECDYSPSYLIDPYKVKLKLYEGVHMPHYYNISTRIYPGDQTWKHTEECAGVSLQPMHCEGNKVLEKKKALWVVGRLMTELEKKHPKRYTVHTIVNVEEGDGDTAGNRYLVELAVNDKKLNKVRRISVYVYKHHNSRTICFPKDFQWNTTSMVHLILTVKNQGPWVQQYIETLSKIYLATNDSNFSLVITDFDSYDIDILEALERSPLKNYKVISKRGKFHKTIAIQEAAATITDENSIVLQTDLHLDMPLNFIDDTRKHCVKGKMGYTPLLMRLACGRFPHNPAGFWESFGYGIFGLTKFDWDYVEGMNVEKFRNAWGGEDWDFADRVIQKGLEIERLRVPYFFHFFHTKKGMWNN